MLSISRLAGYITILPKDSNGIRANVQPSEFQATLQAPSQILDQRRKLLEASDVNISIALQEDGAIGIQLSTYKVLVTRYCLKLQVQCCLIWHAHHSSGFLIYMNCYELHWPSHRHLRLLFERYVTVQVWPFPFWKRWLSVCLSTVKVKKQDVHLHLCMYWFLKLSFFKFIATTMKWRCGKFSCSGVDAHFSEKLFF